LLNNFFRIGVLAAAAGLLSACSGDAKDAKAAPANRAGEAPPVGRGGQTVTLAPTDIDTVTAASISDGVPVTGILRPIESIDVRARLEGDVSTVVVREGQYVHAGDLLASFEAIEMQSAAQSAIADRSSAQTDLQTAVWNLEQTQELFKAGAVPERDVRAAQQAVSSSRARLAAAESRLRSASNTSRDTRVIAPVSGTIEKRFVERGEHLSRGAQMFTLVRNDILELAAAVPEKRASVIRQGQPVQFVANGLAFTGRVARVSATIDPTSRAVTVYVQVPNANGALKGGTFATGTVAARTIANAVVVPISAIRQGVGGTSRVYRIVDKKLEEAIVELGVRDDRAGVVEVTSGVQPGDVIVIGNVGTLGKGMKVEIIVPGARGGRGGAGGGGNVPR
jgi:membrane fusion protein, multidrug efflux system